MNSKSYLHRNIQHTRHKIPIKRFQNIDTTDRLIVSKLYVPFTAQYRGWSDVGKTEWRLNCILFLICKYFTVFKTAVPDPVEIDELPEEVTDENFIILKWTEPKSNGAPITHYTLYYKKLTRDDKLVDKTMTIDKSQLLEQRVDVAGAKTFEFVVTASNSRGESRKDNTKRVNVLGNSRFIENLNDKQ